MNKVFHYLSPFAAIFVSVILFLFFVVSAYPWLDNLPDDMNSLYLDFTNQFALYLLYFGVLIFGAYYTFWLLRIKQHRLQKVFLSLTIALVAIFILGLCCKYSKMTFAIYATIFFIICGVNLNMLKPLEKMLFSLSYKLVVYDNAKQQHNHLWMHVLLPVVAYSLALVVIFLLGSLLLYTDVTPIIMWDYFVPFDYILLVGISYFLFRKDSARFSAYLGIYILVNMLPAYMNYFVEHNMSNVIIFSIYKILALLGILVSNLVIRTSLKKEAHTPI